MFIYLKKYDVIVVGGGHAGIEAALASARMGCRTLLLTMNLDTIGQMSCNPAIGGLAKGHLVREIDALGGEMGKCTDLTGIQFRMLNTRKGPAVWAPRAQCDKKAYQFRMKWICERQSNLDCRQGQTAKLVLNDRGSVSGIVTDLGIHYSSTVVIVTTGTFLRGLMHLGREQQPGGRAGEAAAQCFSDSLRAVGLELGRFKTGTPPRLHRRSLDFSQMELQFGDSPPPYFSFWLDELFHVEHELGAKNKSPRSANTPISRTNHFIPDSVLADLGSQLPCHLTHTTSETAAIVTANLHRSAMYSGAIHGVGPRYCPSIEDKIVRFAGKEQHQIFLEPEGVATEEIYVNGCSTSLPYEVQVGLVRTIVGCENAEIMRPAYAVEYDYVPPAQLFPWLECKTCSNLFCAGQINGTSGYEEAAAQGLVAGINAALRLQGKAPFVLSRDQAYIGVLIDDLVTKNTTEPYRMFTSRAENRLLLRQDNADLRLSEFGRSLGLISDANFSRFQEKRRTIMDEIQRLETTGFGSTTLSQLLRRPELKYRDLPNARTDLPTEVVEQVEVIVKYAGYIARQSNEVARGKTLETKHIPSDFNYAAVIGLRIEARQKLSAVRPTTIGQASRISGVSPADISLLLVHLRRVPLVSAVNG